MASYPPDSALPNPGAIIYRLRFDQVAIYHVTTAPARIQMQTPACGLLSWSLDPTWAQANVHFEGSVGYDPIGKAPGTWYLPLD